MERMGSYGSLFLPLSSSVSVNLSQISITIQGNVDLTDKCGLHGNSSSPRITVPKLSNTNNLDQRASTLHI